MFLCTQTDKHTHVQLFYVTIYVLYIATHTSILIICISDYF